MDNKSAQLPKITFIPDDPASEDSFGSHEGLAKTIAYTIRTQANLKVIGLLGSWGIGKSTVVNLIQKIFKDKTDDVETHFFTYDAWLHQNDPPRRSFFETLINFLIEKRLTKQEQWQERLDQLNGQIQDTIVTSTPRLAVSGYVLLASLLLWPLGIQLIGSSKDMSVASAVVLELSYLSDRNTSPSAAVTAKPDIASPQVVTAIQASDWMFYAGVSCLAAPLLAFVLIWLWWRPTWKIWTKRFWTSNKVPHEHESLLALLWNKEIQQRKNRTIRSPEPTAIEFQDMFREVMKVVSSDKRRFIFVIDNLDRLPETEAVAMWGTIRSFFLGAKRNQLAKLPTVLLPIDKDSVQRMYAAQENAEDLARSFMEKTFDVTFRVTRPVLSDWQKYLKQQMLAVFSTHITPEDIYATSTLYEKSLLKAEGASPVIPRSINTLVNLIATIWLQHQAEGINFVSMAYYAIWKDAIEQNIEQSVFTPMAGVIDLDPNWQQSIAAIYYGVAPTHASQILIEQPLRKAIDETDTKKMEELSVIPGFDAILNRVFEKIVINNPTEMDVIIKASATFASLSVAPSQPWVKTAWRTLRIGIQKTGVWKNIGENVRNSIQHLLDNADASERRQFVDVIISKLGGIDAATANTEIFSADFLAIAQQIKASLKGLGQDLVDIKVPGAASTFINVLAKAKDDEEILVRLETGANQNSIVPELNKFISGGVNDVQASIRGFIRWNKTLPVGDIISTATGLIRSVTPTISSYDPAVLCLGLFYNAQQVAKSEIQNLINDNTMANRLNEAHVHNKSSPEALMIALTVLNRSNIPAPQGLDWNEVLKSRKELLPLIDDALKEFGFPDNLDSLVDLYEANPAALPLIREVVSKRIKENYFANFDVQKIISKYSKYLDCIQPELQGGFAQIITTQQNAWIKISEAPFDNNIANLFHKLMDNEEDFAVDAETSLRAHLNKLSSDSWEKCLRSDGEPLTVTEKLGKISKDKINLGQSLFDALKKTMPEILSNNDDVYRQRWFVATSFLNQSEKVTLLKYLSDQINRGTNVNGLKRFMTIGGESLLVEGTFADEPDDSVRYVILPMLTEEGGIEWLGQNSTIIAAWVSGSSEDIGNVLIERLSTLYKNSGDDQKKLLEKLETEWNLPELSSHISDSTSTPIESKI